MSYTKEYWKIYPINDDLGVHDVVGKNNIQIAKVYTKADAQRIVTCVNSHDDLVEAIKDAVSHIKRDHKRGQYVDSKKDILDILEQAINKAGQQ